jgi:hypothetical protein
MNKDEVLKLALKALELVNIEFVCNGAHHAKKDRHELGDECPVTDRYRQSIIAIKEALAQPEQEPVAWISQKSGFIAHNKPDQSLNPMPLYLAPPPCPTCEALARTVMLDQTSHDTTPPQRTWVGLTDEEIKSCWNWETDCQEWAIEFARAILRKAQEK